MFNMFSCLPTRKLVPHRFNPKANRQAKAERASRAMTQLPEKIDEPAEIVVDPSRPAESLVEAPSEIYFGLQHGNDESVNQDISVIPKQTEAATVLETFVEVEEEASPADETLPAIDAKEEADAAERAVEPVTVAQIKPVDLFKPAAEEEVKVEEVASVVETPVVTPEQKPEASVQGTEEPAAVVVAVVVEEATKAEPAAEVQPAVVEAVPVVEEAKPVEQVKQVEEPAPVLLAASSSSSANDKFTSLRSRFEKKDSKPVLVPASSSKPVKTAPTPSKPALVAETAVASTSTVAATNPVLKTVAGPLPIKIAPADHGLDEAMTAAMMAIAAKPYKDQATWFLNAFWQSKFKDNAVETEKVWNMAHKFVEYDPKGWSGCEIDELRAHRVLEQIDSALTHTEMRSKFHVRARHVSLSELLLFCFSASPYDLVTAPQSAEGVIEQLAQAQALMQQSAAAVEESQARAQQAAGAAKEAQVAAENAAAAKQAAMTSEAASAKRESEAVAAEREAESLVEASAVASSRAANAAAEAKQKEAEALQRAESEAQAESSARQGEEAAKKAEEAAVINEANARQGESDAFQKEEAAREAERAAIEAEKGHQEAKLRVEQALEKVKLEEAAFKACLEGLLAVSQDESKGIVERRKAGHERAQLLAKDPEPLTRARIAEEAVVRRHDRLLHNAAHARAAAVTSRANAETARAEAVALRGKAEEARAEAALHRSAAETKLSAAKAAHAEAVTAQEVAVKARESADATDAELKAVLESANKAKAAAAEARQVASVALQASTRARVEAEASEAAALAAKKSSEESNERAEAAVVEALAAFDRARNFVDKVQRQASSGQGAWWWTSRELTEAKKYIPKKLLSKLDSSA